MQKVLETGPNAKSADQITSHEIIAEATKANPDPLCHLVMKKFAEIFAVQAGDTALKYLPYGGIYLIGGVTMGMRDYIINDPEKAWMNTFYDKGRLISSMKRFPVMILRPETELGILGAEEVAYRLGGSYSLDSAEEGI